MSTIRCIYTVKPNFPATDQHPQAVRYQVGALWVDAIGGQPTQAEIDAVLHPAPVAPHPKITAALADPTVAQSVKDALSVVVTK
jgi:hypothetical protein